jgi:hypothetical protein
MRRAFEIPTWQRFAALSLPFLLAACSARPATVPVKGTLTVDSKPLAGAQVMFHAQDPQGKDATGSTDAAGAFKLSTFQPGDGALPGSYKITVAYSEHRAGPAVKDASEALDAPPKLSPQSLVLPAKYAQPDQTILKHRVPEDGDVKLELQSR